MASVRSMSAEPREAWSTEAGLSFDGRIVEAFGRLSYGSFGRTRFHLSEVRIRATGPDRKGRMSVHLDGGSGSCGFEVDESDWPAFESLTADILSAKDA